jgi:hypothetical protein
MKWHFYCIHTSFWDIWNNFGTILDLSKWGGTFIAWIPPFEISEIILGLVQISQNEVVRLWHEYLLLRDLKYFWGYFRSLKMRLYFYCVNISFWEIWNNFGASSDISKWGGTFIAWIPPFERSEITLELVQISQNEVVLLLHEYLLLRDLK